MVAVRERVRTGAGRWQPTHESTFAGAAHTRSGPPGWRCRAHCGCWTNARTSGIVVRGFAWLVKNRRRHENDLSPMADFAPLLGEPDPSRSTVAEARRMLHDELSRRSFRRSGSIVRRRCSRSVSRQRFGRVGHVGESVPPPSSSRSCSAADPVRPFLARRRATVRLLASARSRHTLLLPRSRGGGSPGSRPRKTVASQGHPVRPSSMRGPTERCSLPQASCRRLRREDFSRLHSSGDPHAQSPSTNDPMPRRQPHAGAPGCGGEEDRAADEHPHRLDCHGNADGL